LESVPPLGARLQEVCAVAKEAADRIEIATISLPSVNVPFGMFVVTRHSRCDAEGLSVVLVTKPAGRRRKEPVLSVGGFFGRWINDLEARGADALPKSTVHQLILAWDEGEDTDGGAMVRIFDVWAYRALDGGVRYIPSIHSGTIPLEEVWDVPRYVPAFSERGVGLVGRNARKRPLKQKESPEERAAYEALIQLIKQNPKRFVQ